MLKAFDALFQQSATTRRLKRRWSPKYIQHSAHIEPGREGTISTLSRAFHSTL